MDEWPIPMNLSTTNVLIRMAIAYKNSTDYASYGWEEIVDNVLDDLGLTGCPDTYGARNGALFALEP